MPRRIKMTTKRYRALRAAAWQQAEELLQLAEVAENADRVTGGHRAAELTQERNVLLNAIDALDSHFPMQREDAAQQALRELSEGED